MASDETFCVIYRTLLFLIIDGSKRGRRLYRPDVHVLIWRTGFLTFFFPRSPTFPARLRPFGRTDDLAERFQIFQGEQTSRRAMRDFNNQPLFQKTFQIDVGSFERQAELG
ncbi:hypothetical protein WG31_14600 (plasmid) [Acetobacter oryzifermentans]|uniref:Uncharacterized protein n=1 Tax=Acetobacter oryzifermentans TaxID=1633874 RepID=A0ABM6ANU1_9PROT|nr:hypothetical protein WG31_14600 [Acetobacter oryzifermentans]